VTAPLTRWAGEVLPPAAAPARRRPAHRAITNLRGLTAEAASVLRLRRSRPRHRAASYIAQLERDLAAANYSVSEYLASREVVS
jgi:hypothetical protein